MTETIEWVRTQMPMYVEYDLDGSDEWVRVLVRGETSPESRRPRLQAFVVHGTVEADRVLHAVARLKGERKISLGGARQRRAVEWKKK